MEKDVELFLNKIIEFAESKDGKAGLEKMLTQPGQFEYMKMYMSANEETYIKFICASREVQEEIKQVMARTIYQRVNEAKD